MLSQLRIAGCHRKVLLHRVLPPSTLHPYDAPWATSWATQYINTTITLTRYYATLHATPVTDATLLIVTSIVTDIVTLLPFTDLVPYAPSMLTDLRSPCHYMQCHYMQCHYMPLISISVVPSISMPYSILIDDPVNNAMIQSIMQMLPLHCCYLTHYMDATFTLLSLLPIQLHTYIYRTLYLVHPLVKPFVCTLQMLMSSVLPPSHPFHLMMNLCTYYGHSNSYVASVYL